MPHLDRKKNNSYEQKNFLGKACYSEYAICIVQFWFTFTVFLLYWYIFSTKYVCEAVFELVNYYHRYMWIVHNVI